MRVMRSIKREKRKNIEKGKKIDFGSILLFLSSEERNKKSSKKSKKSKEPMSEVNRES